jgi:hypothetical protein
LGGNVRNLAGCILEGQPEKKPERDGNIALQKREKRKEIRTRLLKEMGSIAHAFSCHSLCFSSILPLYDY